MISVIVIFGSVRVGFDVGVRVIISVDVNVSN